MRKQSLVVNLDFNMKFEVLASGSRSNGYILYNQKEALVLEAGVSLLKVKKALDFNLKIIRGCLVTHSHSDHAKHIRQYADAGIPVMAPGEVFDQPHHRYYSLSPGKGYKTGGFRIIPFRVSHDVPCFGYLIDHSNTGKILFLSDTYLCEYVFPSLNQVIIEANYADDILEENIFRGEEHPSKQARLLLTHMELQTTKKVLMAQDLSKVLNIVLIHLSDKNSDEARFVREVSALTGKQVFAARKGLTIQLTQKPF